MNTDRNCKRKHLREKLMSELAARNAASGSRIPTVRKLAAQWQVSPLTVSRLLNDMTKSGILYRQPHRGYFLAEDFPETPRIGYLGPLPPANGMTFEYIFDESLKALFDEFSRQHITPEIFNYADFISRRRAPVKLEKLNGLLISGGFFDLEVMKKLFDFSGQIVVMDHFFPENTLPSHNVNVDYRRALNSFFKHYPLSTNKKYVIIRAAYSNAEDLSSLIRDYLMQAELPLPEEVVLAGSFNAEMEAVNYFSSTDRDWSNTLIFSLSGYYSRGLYRALYGKKVMPDVLSFDNLEDRLLLPGREDKYFTSIERNLHKLHRRGVQLLCDLIRNRTCEIQNIGIEAELIVRKSIKN